MKQIIIIVFIALTTLPLKSALAQLNPTVSVNTTVDDNIFRSPDAVSDKIISLNAYLEYLPDKSNLSFFYSGVFNRFQQYSDRNTQLHDFGISHYFLFGNENTGNIYWGADFLMKSDEEAYRSYDYNQFYLYGNVKYVFPKFTLKGGYSYRSRDYVNDLSLSNSRHFFFLQGLKSFSTRTTFQIEADYGLKTFGQENGLIPSTTGIRRMRRFTNLTSQQPTLSQAIFIGKIAQGITDDIGISAWYKKQIALTPEAVFSNPDAYNQDAELFDDPFSFESDEYNGKLKMILPWNINIDLGVGFANKTYSGENSFVSAADTIGIGDKRADQQSSFSLGLEKNFNIGKSWLYSISVYGDYYYLRNTSNSYWYNYNSNYISVGLDINF